MTEPDDRELESYLKGGSRLSQRYREAGGEITPPALDEQVLAQARAAVRPRKPRTSAWLGGLALAASLVLAVNLGWNLRQHARPDEPPPPVFVPDAPREQPASPPIAAERAPAPLARAAPPSVPEAPGRDAQPSARAAEAERDHQMEDSAAMAASADAAADAEAKAEARSREKLQARQQALAFPERESFALSQRRAESAAAPAAGAAAPPVPGSTAAEPPQSHPPLTEPEKIERLIRHIAQLQGAVFIRNGDEHAAPAAADHLRLKLDKAGDRVRTARDFIELCATRSSMSGEPYRIRFADGTERAAAEVLTEQLLRLERGG